MKKPAPDEFLEVFMKYNDEWQELAEAYWRIPRWPIYHFIMQQRNINARGRLTQAYVRQMKEWGLI